MNISYIILKRVIWRFQLYNLFREKFKFCGDKSNNVFREILKCFRTTASFYSAKLCILACSGDGDNHRTCHTTVYCFSRGNVVYLWEFTEFLVRSLNIILLVLNRNGRKDGGQ